MEVGLVAFGMRQGPIGLAPILLLDDGRESQLPFLLGVDGNRGAKRPPGEIVLDADVGPGLDPGVLLALAGAREVVRIPFAGRREIPFAISLLAGGAEEGLEAGRFPELVRTGGLRGLRNVEAMQRRADPEPDVGRRDAAERCGVIDVDPHLEFRIGWWSCGMWYQ